MSGTGNTQAISQDVSNKTLAPEYVAQTDIDVQKENNFPILSEQERAFGYEYIANGYNHRKAAQKCGHSANTGISLKRRPYVAAFIAYLQEKSFCSELVVKDFIDAKLDELYDMAIGDTEVPIVLGDGTSMEAKKFQGTLALNILQERSKMNGITKEADIGNTGVKVYIDMRAALGEKEVSAEPIEANFVEITA